MFLRSSIRKKNGKEHEYYSIVENRRLSDGRIQQRHVLYLGEINGSQAQAWRKTIEVFEDGKPHPSQIALFPADRTVPIDEQSIVKIQLNKLALHRPRQWGACWLGCHLYEQLNLDRFWDQKLKKSRKGTRWDLTLKLLVIYRLVDPGSEWNCYRQWFESTAMADLLGGDEGLAQIHKLYSCQDLILKHKKALFDHLTQRWKDLFNAQFDVLLYDLTSTYFESDPNFEESDKRKFGYSRDKRFDCVQVVIALIVTPDGFPIAYEVLAGNTKDDSTLADFLKKIQDQYGKARRIWIMDRGIPTKEVLQQMRESDPPVQYLVGTPRGLLTQLEKALLDKPWHQVREGIQVKLLEHENELYVFAQSHDRINKERSMRRRQLKGLWARLKGIQKMKQSRDQLLMRIGAAKQQYPTGWRFVDVKVSKTETTFKFKLLKDKLRTARKREGRYLLRTNIEEKDPVKLWKYYLQLNQIEEAFKNLKGDLAIRPIHHQKMDRIEAHIFISFIAYCLLVTLANRLKRLAPGLTPRAVLDKFRLIQMIDVHLPTTDNRTVILTRYTQPENDHKILLKELKLQLPEQPPPKITTVGVATG